MEDKMLRELFRQRLEKAEVHSSPTFEVQFFRKLEKKEFLRFDPCRFNAWYAGAVITAAALGISFYLNGSSVAEADVALPESFSGKSGIITLAWYLLKWET